MQAHDLDSTKTMIQTKGGAAKQSKMMKNMKNRAPRQPLGNNGEIFSPTMECCHRFYQRANIL